MKEDMAKLLGELLKQAEAGKLKAIAVVFEADDEEIGHHFFLDQGAHDLGIVGALEALKVDILDAETEGEVHG